MHHMFLCTGAVLHMQSMRAAPAYVALARGLLMQL
jgi:hypothetical protein